MRNAVGQRLPLKSTLLVGVAGMAAAMSSSAFAADPASTSASSAPAASPTPPVAAPAPAASTATPIPAPKWLPSVDIGGGVGSGFAIGRAEALIPVWQDLDSLAFVRFGADTRTHFNDDFNIGLGYRTKIDSDWLIGVFAGIDSSQSDFTHTFKQYSIGGEAMSADWDIRANAYFADHSSKPINDKFQLYIHDTTIAILQAQEAALSGFDGEIGYRVFNTDSTDVRVYAGGYSFHHSDVNTAGVGTNFSIPYKDIAGPKLRAEVNIFDIDALGAQSRISFEGEVSHDSVNHTSEFLGATLRIALDDTSGQGAQALDELDRRMADPVRRRDNVLTQYQFNKPEPVIIYNGAIRSQPTNTLYYVEQRSGTGAGTYTDPTTLKDATGRGPVNQFIVLTDQGGSTIDTQGAVIQKGETVTGAGTFQVRGENSGHVFTHDFAPGSGAVSLTSSSGPVITLGPDTTLSGVTITGPFDTAIYGSNVSNIHITDVTIDGNGTGQNGIVINQTDTSGTANIDIDNVSITGVTHDGIDLNVSGSGASTSTTNMNISNSTIQAGHDGVAVTSSTAGSSDLTVYAGIHNSNLTAGNIAAIATGTSSVGSTLNQTLIVDPTTLSGGNYGIRVKANANGGALTQNIGISDVTISDEAKGDVVIGASANNGGTLDQTISITDLNAGASATPLLITGKANHNGTVDQSLTGSHLSVGVGQYNNIGFYASAHHTATVDQTSALSHVTANDATVNGIYLFAFSISGATTLQHVSVSDLHASRAGYDGVREVLAVAGTGSLAAQYLFLSDATLKHSGHDGVQSRAISSVGSVARQDVYVSGADVSHAGNDGVEVYSEALNGSSMQQNPYLYNVTATHAGVDGISIFNFAADGLAFAGQGGAIYKVDVSHAGQDGLVFNSSAIAADAEQQMYAYYVTAEHEGRNGVTIQATSDGYATGSVQTYPAHVEQDLGVIYGSLSHNTNDGVSIIDQVGDSAALDQSVFLYGVHIDSNKNHGVELVATLAQSTGTFPTSVAQAHLYSALYVENSTADKNTSDGIHIYSEAVGTPNIQVHGTIDGADVSSNGGDGISDTLKEVGTYGVYVLNNGLDIAGSLIDHNAGDGIDIKSAAFGPTVLIFNLNVSGSDVSHNGVDGIYDYSYASGFDSLNLHYLTLSGSHFDSNGANGVSMVASQNYGLGVRGIAGQIATFKKSDFSYNIHDGVYSHANSIGPNGRTEQYFYISGSRFDHNGHDGLDMNRTTSGGKYYTNYNCNVPQYSYGGCAFVRQVVHIDGSDFSQNTANGIELDTTLLNYGSAYSSAGHPGGTPTLQITNSTINHNGGDGIFIHNGVGYGSSEYQFVYIGGTQIAHNGGDGIHISNYNLGSSQIQIVELVGSNVSNNTGDGIYSATKAGYAGDQVNLLVVYGSTLNKNGGSGVDLSSTVASSLYAFQGFYAVASKFDHNAVYGAHVGGYVAKTYYGYQIIKSDGDDFSKNGAQGLNANFGMGYGLTGGQYVTSVSDTFLGNGAYGITTAIAVTNQVYANQAVSLTGDTASNNVIGANILGASVAGPLTQSVTIDDGSFSGNSHAGVGFATVAQYGSSTITAKLTVEGGASFSGNVVGLAVGDTAGYGSTISQANYVYASTFSDNSVAGVDFGALDAGQTAVVQGNTFSGNAIGISGFAEYGANQSINVHTNAHTGDTHNYNFTHDAYSTQTITY